MLNQRAGVCHNLDKSCHSVSLINCLGLFQTYQLSCFFPATDYPLVVLIRVIWSPWRFKAFLFLCVQIQNWVWGKNVTTWNDIMKRIIPLLIPQPQAFDALNHLCLLLFLHDSNLASRPFCQTGLACGLNCHLGIQQHWQGCGCRGGGPRWYRLMAVIHGGSPEIWETKLLITP